MSLHLRLHIDKMIMQATIHRVTSQVIAAVTQFLFFKTSPFMFSKWEYSHLSPLLGKKINLKLKDGN